MPLATSCTRTIPAASAAAANAGLRAVLHVTKELHNVAINAIRKRENPAKPVVTVRSIAMSWKSPPVNGSSDPLFWKMLKFWPSPQPKSGRSCTR